MLPLIVPRFPAGKGIFLTVLFTGEAQDREI